MAEVTLKRAGKGRARTTKVLRTGQLHCVTTTGPRLERTVAILVRSRINDILAAYPGVGYLDLLADGRLEHGACILESEIGMVEASLEGQIEALRGAFQRTLGSRV